MQRSRIKRVRLTTTIDETTARLTGNAVDTENQTTPNTWDNKRHDEYRYDAAGNITTVAERPNGVTLSAQCFSYDGLRRLTEVFTNVPWSCGVSPVAAGPDPYWHTYSYNDVGNRTQLVDHAVGGNITTTYTHHTPGGVRPHALTSSTTTGVPGGNSYGYDNAGNMTDRNVGGTTQTLAWDPEGQLASHTINGQTTTCVYAADGSRLLRKDPNGITTAYLGDYEIVKDACGALTGTRFYGDIATRTTAGKTWTTTDHHGTAQVAINATTLAVTTQVPALRRNPRHAVRQLAKRARLCGRCQRPHWPDPPRRPRVRPEYRAVHLCRPGSRPQ